MEYQAVVLGLDYDELMDLSGPDDQNIKELEKLYKCPIVIRDDKIKILTDDEKVYDVFIKHIDSLCKLLKAHQKLNKEIIDQSYIAIKGDDKKYYDDLNTKIITSDHENHPIKARTLGQMRLVKAIEDNTVTIVSGPAGSGKTYLAVTMATKALKDGDVKKIVLTRPVVEAGESLGFLPGDLKEKVDPYLMPLYDALDELLGHEKVEGYIERGIIEIIPLAYMRGRSLKDAFIILDEAQNTTSMQMFMFLTRLAQNSKMVITGDLSQIDREATRGNISGLKEACNNLTKMDDIAIINLKEDDIVRHPLVKTIIDRYDQNRSSRSSSSTKDL